MTPIKMLLAAGVATTALMSAPQPVQAQSANDLLRFLNQLVPNAQIRPQGRYANDDDDDGYRGYRGGRDDDDDDGYRGGRDDDDDDDDGYRGGRDDDDDDGGRDDDDD